MFPIIIENLKNLKYHNIFRKHEVFLLFTVSVFMNIKNIFKKNQWKY